MISVVVPNFNSGKRLAQNLPRLVDLLGKSKLDYEVIVVDDASTDSSVEDLKSQISNLKSASQKLKLITKDKNTGFGITVDRGIREAKGEVVFVLNAIDILPEKADYFKIILEHFKDLKVFSVAALKRDEEDHGCGEIYFEKGFFLHRRKLVTSHQSLVTSSWADGGAQAIRREYYLKIGGFDPLYKFYWEDVDLGYRAWKAGFEVRFEPRAVLLHQKAEGPIAKYYTQRQRRVMNLRNQMIFLGKNADLRHLLLGIVWWPYHVAVAIKNGDIDFFVASFQVKLMGFQVFAARTRQTELAKLPDDEVLSLFS